MNISPLNVSRKSRGLWRWFAFPRTLLIESLVLCVWVYQHLLRGVMGVGACRFQPTCSAYMIEALRRHGLFKGLALGVWRILRCNPFSKGGHDPVP